MIASLPPPRRCLTRPVFPTVDAVRQEAANDAMRAAQAGWGAERLVAEALTTQMVDAYEAQALELTSAQAGIAEGRPGIVPRTAIFRASH